MSRCVQVSLKYHSLRLRYVCEDIRPDSGYHNSGLAVTDGRECPPTFNPATVTICSSNVQLPSTFATVTFLLLPTSLCDLTQVQRFAMNFVSLTVVFILIAMGAAQATFGDGFGININITYVKPSLDRHIQLHLPDFEQHPIPLS